MYAVPQDLIDLLAIPDGGFTWDAYGGKEITSGYAVSVLKSREYRVPFVPSTLGDHVKVFMENNADLLTRAPPLNVGAWHDPESGDVFLDVTMVVRNEGFARRLAVTFGQIAYYDFANQKSVPLLKNPNPVHPDDKA